MHECSSRLELIRGFTVKRSISPGRGLQNPSPAYRSRSPSPPMPEPRLHVHQPTEVRPTESPTSTEELHPLPNPNGSVEDEGQDRLDERSLNVLAAREISKHMGISGSPLSPPSLPFTGRKSVSPRPSFTTDIPPSNNDNTFGQILPPPPEFTNSTQNRDVTPSLDLQQPHQFQPPPIGNLPHSASVDSAVSDLTQVDDAYHTPPEYLRNLSTPPSPSMNPAYPLQVQVPRMSPILPSPLTPSTAKISAAAFRRPGMKGSANTRDDSLRQGSLAMGFRLSPGRSPSRERGENENAAGTPENTITPLNLRKKSLPSVPGPPSNPLSGPRDQGGGRSVSSPFPNMRTSGEQQDGPGRMPRLSGSPESRPRESMLGGEEEFDYVSAYLNEDERGEGTVHNGATDGYGSGRFSTKLDG